jgi:hypothetical protein
MAGNDLALWVHEKTARSSSSFRVVELTAAPNHYAVTIRFQDSTSLTFSMEPCVAAFPVFSEWTDGEEKQLK